LLIFEIEFLDIDHRALAINETSLIEHAREAMVSGQHDFRDLFSVILSWSVEFSESPIT